MKDHMFKLQRKIWRHMIDHHSYTCMYKQQFKYTGFIHLWPVKAPEFFHIWPVKNSMTWVKQLSPGSTLKTITYSTEIKFNFWTCQLIFQLWISLPFIHRKHNWFCMTFHDPHLNLRTFQAQKMTFRFSMTLLQSLIIHAALTQPEHLILVTWMGLETQWKMSWKHGRVWNDFKHGSKHVAINNFI